MWTNSRLAAFCSAFGFEPICTGPEAAELCAKLDGREQLAGIMEAFLSGYFRGIAGRGLVVLTDKRIIFFRKSVVGRDTFLETDLSEIVFVRMDEPAAALEIATEKEKIVFTQCNRRLAARLAGRIAGSLKHR